MAWKQAWWPPLYHVFNISLYCSDTIPSFIGNLWRVLLLGNHLKSIQALISTSYSALRLPVIIRHFEPDHVALVKLGSKRVYVSVSVKHNCTRFSVWNFQMIIAMAENCEWANCLLSCDWRWVALCVVNSEFAWARRTSWHVPLIDALLGSLSSSRETSFSGIKEIRKAGVVEQKRQNRIKKKKKKRAIKDHKNDWLTDVTHLKLVMKNKLTKSSFYCREIQLIEPNSQCLGLLGLLWGNLERNFKDCFCWCKETGIGISRQELSGLRDLGKIPVGMAGLKNPIGDPRIGITIYFSIIFLCQLSY